MHYVHNFHHLPSKETSPSAHRNRPMGLLLPSRFMILSRRGLHRVETQPSEIVRGLPPCFHASPPFLGDAPWANFWPIRSLNNPPENPSSSLGASRTSKSSRKTSTNARRPNARLRIVQLKDTSNGALLGHRPAWAAKFPAFSLSPHLITDEKQLHPHGGALRLRNVTDPQSIPVLSVSRGLPAWHPASVPDAIGPQDPKSKSLQILVADLMTHPHGSGSKPGKHKHPYKSRGHVPRNR